jgi:hypothetical protein
VTAASYPPSWQNRFFAFVGRLPVPRLLVYLLITVGAVLLLSLAPWVDGSLPLGTFDPDQATFWIWLPVALVACDYFLGAAGTALDEFRPALGIDDDAFSRVATNSPRCRRERAG